MNNRKITIERNAQIVIALMKAHNIKKIVASPGTMNVCLIASIQDDPFFEIYSAADERSAGYIACGMAAETGETVALSCTGATASRNYMPALTEAYYRQLPVLVVTSSKRSMYIGHNIEQMTDRTLLPRDVARISVQAAIVTDKETEWQCEMACNKAFLELHHHGTGPVHINLETQTNWEFVTNPKPVRIIRRYENMMALPEINAGKVVVIVGSHKRWTSDLTEEVDRFCENYNGVVLCDQTSNYKGRYGVYHGLAMLQHHYSPEFFNADLVVHIGDVSSANFNINAKKVWRVSEDGEVRDTIKALSAIFEMTELQFFSYYSISNKESRESLFFQDCRNEIKLIYQKIPELPFSSIYIAYKYAGAFPENTIVHYGIRNSLRVFGFFEQPKSVLCYSNTGGFGIDGCMSSAIGGALCNPDRLCFCILGDLAFFYDMNSLGNRHIGKNLRIILLNNGTGMEMNYSDSFPGIIGAERDRYIAASGHYGNKSKDIVKHYAEDLGLRYLSASTKQEFERCIEKLLDNTSEKSVLCEIFIDKEKEDEAFYMVSRLMTSKESEVKQKLKMGISKAIGEKGRKIVKTVLSE